MTFFVHCSAQRTMLREKWVHKIFTNFDIFIWEENASIWKQPQIKLQQTSKSLIMNWTKVDVASVSTKDFTSQNCFNNGNFKF